MAVVPYTRVETSVDGRNVKLFKWTNLQGLDTGQPLVVAEYNDKTIQLQGATFGSGVTIQANLDPAAIANGTTWDTLSDPQGNPLAGITAEKVENILEHCYLVRPNAAAGVVDVTVWILLASVR